MTRSALNRQQKTKTALAVGLLLGLVSLGATAAGQTFETKGAAQPRPEAGTFEGSLKGIPFGQVVVRSLDGRLVADGASLHPIEIEALDRKGARIAGNSTVTVEVSSNSVLFVDREKDKAALSGVARAAAQGDAFVYEVDLKDGVGRFFLRAPASPSKVQLKAIAGGVHVAHAVEFAPEMRQMIAAGYVEAIVAKSARAYDSGISPARINDGFEETLNGFARSSDSGVRGAVTGSLYLKGKIKGDRLLTLAFDSDKETRQRLQRDVDQDKYYAVYGDSSVSVDDMRSDSRLYIRIDDKNGYALYGRFNTADSTEPRVYGVEYYSQPKSGLAEYSRNLNGIKVSRTLESVDISGFVAEAKSSKASDEIRANGTSGPFGVSRPYAVADSERIVLVTRQRSDLTRVVSQTTIQRGVDYVFEPFSGRILLTRQLPSEDASGNPNFIRIDYEVENDSGEKELIAGAKASVRIGKNSSLSGSAVVSGEGESRYSLAGVGAKVEIAPFTQVSAEFAASKGDDSRGLVPTDPVGDGKAARVELSRVEGDTSVRASWSKVNSAFRNSTSGAIPGTETAAVEGTLLFGEGRNLKAKLAASEIKSAEGRKAAAEASIGWVASDVFSMSAGLRLAREEGSVPGVFAGIGDQPVGSSFFSGGERGYAGVFSQPNAGASGSPDLQSSAAFIGARYRFTPKLDVFGEIEAPFGEESDRDPSGAIGAAYQVGERTRLFGRAEWASEGRSKYSIDPHESGGIVSFGIESAHDYYGAMYSELRMRDAVDGAFAQQQLAFGTRNTWRLSPKVALSGSFERLHVFSGDAQQGTAVTAGLDWTPNARLKSTGRVEWRRLSAGSTHAATQDSVLFTAGLVGKLSRDWTALARNYYLAFDNHGTKPNAWQDRFQIGVAYRPVDNNRFDALAKFELKKESEILGAAESRFVQVGSTHFNWHPSRPWHLSGRIAAKTVSERFPTTDGGASSRYKAALVGGRVTYDITENWDVGSSVYVMKGTGGAVQHAFGLEVGRFVASNVWLSLGGNLSGFNDPDLISGYTSKGVYLRIRWKFSHDLLSKEN